MTLRVIPDIYRLNAKQRDTLLDLYNERRIESPVTVSYLSDRRRAVSDVTGAAYIIDPDGTLRAPTSR